MDADDVLVKEEDLFEPQTLISERIAYTLYSSCSNLKKKIGVGLFPILSRSFNHSCDPNAEFFNVHLRLCVDITTCVWGRDYNILPEQRGEQKSANTVGRC